MFYRNLAAEAQAAYDAALNSPFPDWRAVAELLRAAMQAGRGKRMPKPEWSGECSGDAGGRDVTVNAPGPSAPSTHMISRNTVTPVRRSSPAQRTAQYEPLYDIDPRTGATIEVFYADQALAKCFGMRSAGWLWWSCLPGYAPDTLPIGPFATNYGALRDAFGGTTAQSGRRPMTPRGAAY